MNKPYQLTESIFGLIKITKLMDVNQKEEWHAVFLNGPYKGMKSSHPCGANGAIQEIIANAYWDMVHNSRPEQKLIQQIKSMYNAMRSSLAKKIGY